MLVQNALRIARCSAGIAQHARIALADFYPFKLAVLLADPIFKGRGMIAAVKANVMIDRGPTILHFIDNGLKGCIIKQHFVFGMIDDIFELIFEKARVHCVQYPAHPCNTVPAHQMARVVHG